MKSYTDIEQSEKLTEILSKDSADMSYSLDFDSEKYEVTTTPYKNWVIPKYAQTYKGLSQAIPCWSLVALLDVLPPGKVLLHDKNGLGYKCICNNIDTDFYDNPIDACVGMILKLNELKLLFTK